VENQKLFIISHFIKNNHEKIVVILSLCTRRRIEESASTSRQPQQSILIKKKSPLTDEGFKHCALDAIPQFKKITRQVHQNCKEKV
jgi:hypothetical protein